MDAFNGKWKVKKDEKDEKDVEIVVTGEKNFLTVKYSNGRGPFQGFEIDLTSPVINVNFTDDKPWVGVLGVNNGKTIIYWINGTTWTKQ